MTLDWSVVWEHRQQFLDGALMTILLTVLTMAIAVPGGLLLALLRMSPIYVVRIATTGFVEFFRATPLILQIYWAFYVLPAAFGIRLPEFATGLIGLSLNVSAFNSETFRAGIISIRRGQTNAGLALGMSRTQVFTRIVLPQAMMRVLPALANTWVSLFKDTSLVSTIAIAELSYVSLQLRAQTFRFLEILTAMAGIYWLMGYPQAKFADWIHRRFRVHE
jgi:His/Glu/Gln/Arg/opine family amino acid ABC transporter permease subunit